MRRLFTRKYDEVFDVRSVREEIEGFDVADLVVVQENFDIAGLSCGIT